MNDFFLALFLGFCAGIIDIIPMIKQKLNRFSIASAFIQWIVLGLIISTTSFFGLKGWLNGLVIAMLLSLPIAILVMENDKKSVPIILSMSAVLGGMIGFASFKLGL
jgi:hypothetical protein